MISIVEGELPKAYELSLRIPEFEPHYSLEKWQSRLQGKDVICLTAYFHQALAGFKVGYFEDNHFYSWVGGVDPIYRRNCIATALADYLEDILKSRGMDRLRMKTRNRFKPMLMLALKSGFDICEVFQPEGEADIRDLRIVLEKKL